MIFPFPFPLAVFTASHDADDFAVHDTFAVTPNSLLLAAAAEKLRELADSASVTAAADVVRNAPAVTTNDPPARDTPLLALKA